MSTADLTPPLKHTLTFHHAHGVLFSVHEGVFPCDGPTSRTFVLADLCARGLVSTMDQMMLSQLKAKLEKIAAKLLEGV